MGYFKEIETEKMSFDRNLEIQFTFSELDYLRAKTGHSRENIDVRERDIFTLDLFGSACEGEATFVKGYECSAS